MPYVASLLKVAQMLEHDGARVLIAVDSPQYAQLLMSIISDRMADGTKPWAEGTLYYSNMKITLPNGASLWVRDFKDIEEVYEMAGVWYSNVLYTHRFPAHIPDWLRRLARMSGEFTGKVSCQQLEEWRDNPLVKPKEPDDKAVL